MREGVFPYARMIKYNSLSAGAKSESLSKHEFLSVTLGSAHSPRGYTSRIMCRYVVANSAPHAEQF